MRSQSAVSAGVPIIVITLITVPSMFFTLYEFLHGEYIAVILFCCFALLLVHGVTRAFDNRGRSAYENDPTVMLELFVSVAFYVLWLIRVGQLLLEYLK